MTPFFLNQFPSIPLEEGDDEEQSHYQPFTVPTDHTSNPSPIIFHTPQVQQQIEPNIDHLVIQGSSDRPMSIPPKANNGGSTLKRPSCNQYVKDVDQCGSGRWMSSKMRFMKKMMDQDGTALRKPRRNKQQLQKQQQSQESVSGNSASSSNSPSSGIVRVCSDCNTTKTPLWRSGPSGPKSLCNACGIRQRKARRAMAAAAVSGGLIPAFASNMIRKGRKSDIDCTVPFKKRCRFTAAGVAHKKICFDDIVIRLSKSKAFHRVFPQDEKDAAILLMALSCGLICS